ncbi:hypothetical protein ACVBEF_13085 [Glaciimonas sp. GG7]
MSTIEQTGQTGQTVVGVFDHFQAAQQAQRDLITSGFAAADVHVRMHQGHASGLDMESHVSRGLTESLRDLLGTLFGSHHDDIAHYSEAIRRGHVVVAIFVADDALVPVAQSALRNAGALDIEKQAQSWQREGYTDFDPASAPYTVDEIIADRAMIRAALVDNPDINSGNPPEVESVPSPRIYPFRMAQTPYDDIMGMSGGVHTGFIKI